MGSSTCSLSAVPRRVSILPAVNVLVTGANGTVGRALCASLEAAQTQVSRWDRAEVPPHDLAAVHRFVVSGRFDRVFHLAVASTPSGIDNEGWRINVQWPEALAHACAESGAGLVFTSTAMVFSNDAKGPFRVDSPPDAQGGYGFEKHRAEDAVLEALPSAVVVRLGWQIGDAPGSNNMIDFFATQMRDHGCVAASTRWLPACSFLTDTAATLVELADATGGRYHLDANDGWSFFDIATELSALHGDAWTIQANEDFVYDQRLLDERVRIPSLSSHLVGLRSRPHADL